MKCEQVKEQLSAYLDDQLAHAEHTEVAAHLQSCEECTTFLIDLRRFDALLTRLPRVTPDDALREKIFSSAEYKALTGTFGVTTLTGQSGKRHRWNTGRPYLVALPTVQAAPSPQNTHSMLGARPGLFQAPHPVFARLFISALLVLVVGLGMLISWRMWQQQPSLAANTQDRAPDQNSVQKLPEGMRLVFQRDDALWSAPGDGTQAAARLTPASVSVAEHWIVRPARPGRNAGNMLAYINLKDAHVHLIHSDSQDDTVVPQPLLKADTVPASVWDTETGAAILNSLAWSPDGNMLAFVADPQGTGRTALYIYRLDDNAIETLPLAQSGRATHPVWSPDSVRIAFVFRQEQQNGILDYNVRNQGLLTITADVATPEYSNDSVLDLAWSPDINQPALTWSVGSDGHVHSIWWQRIGIEPGTPARQLIQGDFRQATYSPNSYAESGGWLLVTARSGDLTTVDLTSATEQITQDGAITMAQWSPDGSTIIYINNLGASAPEMGTLHIVEIASGNDTLIAPTVARVPAPAWSLDSQRLVYSTDKAPLVAERRTLTTAQPLPVQGIASAFTWSAIAPDQLILALNEGQTGLYQVNLSSNTAVRMDTRGASGPLLWTQIP